MDEFINVDSRREIVAKQGDPVPAQTSGKAKAGGAGGGAGAAIGTLITAGATWLVTKATGGQVSGEVLAAIGFLGGVAGAAVAGYLGAYYKRNYLQ